MSRTELRSLDHVITLECKDPGCTAVYNVKSEEYVEWTTTGLLCGKFPCTSCGCNIFTPTKEETVVYLDDRFTDFKKVRLGLGAYLKQIEKSSHKEEAARSTFLYILKYPQYMKMMGTFFLNTVYEKMSDWLSSCDVCVKDSKSRAIEKTLAQEVAHLIFGEHVEWDYCKSCEKHLRVESHKVEKRMASDGNKGSNKRLRVE
jgi:hypothetical protein